MRRPGKQRAGFSLVEVVLAIGIVGFALVSIFSLFSVSLQTNSSVVDQVEALSAVKALPAFLESANATPSDYKQQGFATVYNLAKSPTAVTSAPPIYAYNVPVAAGSTASPGTPGQSAVLFATDPALTTASAPMAAANRQGRLFGVYLTVSPNFPVGATVYPTPGTLGSYNPSPSPSPGGYPEGVLAVQVKVYVLPQIGAAPPSGAYPVLTYDLTVSH